MNIRILSMLTSDQQTLLTICLDYRVWSHGVAISECEAEDKATFECSHWNKAVNSSVLLLNVGNYMWTPL